MAKVVSASDASDRLGTLLDEVRLRDTAFVIERDGMPAAALVPVGLLDQVTTAGFRDRITKRGGTGSARGRDRETSAGVDRQRGLDDSNDRAHANGHHSSDAGDRDGVRVGRAEKPPANDAASPYERPIDRIAALRSMLAEPHGGERFEAVLERTFANVRKQRRKQLRRGRNV